MDNNKLENQPRTLIFIRPRRFGKSLFISMMQAYYDKAMKGRFDELFGNQENILQILSGVEALRQGTQMHKIIMQFVGWELLRMEEV